ncbi:MAG: restriction endonuclease subunit S [Agathobacter sp.]|nr:restriction endonuclease subunit S [Agathobacter sp.]
MGKPKIRFKGYTDDWEQRKLSELGEIMTGSTPSTSKTEYYSEDGIPWVTPTDINEQTICDTPRKLSEEGAKVGRVVPANTILCTCIASIGKNTLLTVKGSFNQQINSLTPNEDNDAYFLLTESENWSDKMKRMAASGTMQIVNKTEFSELLTIVPKLEEQKKIGTYFRNLDHLITLHQRKCEETKKLKKYMLQKMFPRNGQVVPEIRFSGFTDDWEQRKLGEVFEQTSNLVNPKEDEIELWSLTVEDGLTKKSDRYNREFLVKKDDNFKEVRPGDIVYNPMNMTLGAVGYNDMAKSVAVSGYYTTMVTKENYDTYYINTWLKSPQAIQLYRTYATGSLIEKQRVQFPTLSIIPVAFPKYEEQTKIGSYFHSLDHLITLHQRKQKCLKKVPMYIKKR